jgi:hypothetical protein
VVVPMLLVVLAVVAVEHDVGCGVEHIVPFAKAPGSSPPIYYVSMVTAPNVTPLGLVTSPVHQTSRTWL